MTALQAPRTAYEVIQCGGGLDLVTPTLSLKNGVLKKALNFECNTSGGYTKIDGYIRYDGQTSPLTARYATVFFSVFNTVPAIGSTIVNQSATASGLVIAIYNDHLAYTTIIGSFAVGDVVSVGAVTIGTCIAPLTISTAEDATNYALAQDIIRAAINPVPGVGPTIGGFILNGIIYAFRSNVGGTSLDLYKSSSSSWVQVPYLYELIFTAGGNVAPADGATITQGAVTATINRVMRESGAWVGMPGTAVGKLIITAPAGGNFAAGAATIGGVNVTLSGAQTQITMLPGGKIEYVNANFTGSYLTERIYACDGINKEFEFDGVTLCPIDNKSGKVSKHIIMYRNYLILMVDSSIIWSGLGLPFDFTVISGAGELALGDIGTGMKILPGTATTSALNIMTRNNTMILYGTDATNWQLMSYNTGVGATDYTLKNMEQTFGFDSRGIFGLQTTLQYGNFNQTMLTRNIQPLIDRSYSKASYACINHRKSQYRLFFSDGTGLYLTSVNGHLLGVMPVYFTAPVYMVFEDKFVDGSDASFFFSSDGYVYQMEQGDSFDGQAMPHHITLVFDSVKSPRILKRFMKASIELYSKGYAKIGFGYALGYNSPFISQPLSTDHQNVATEIDFDNGSFFDAPATFFDGQAIAPIDCGMGGTAENISITIGGNDSNIAQYTVNSIIVHYQMRRGKR